MAGIEFLTWEIICYCFIFVAGLLGNLTVITVVLKSGSAQHRFREVPFNIYLMSLAIVDLIFAVTCLPIYILSSGIFDHPTGVKGDIFCKLITGYFIPFWLCDVSIFTLVIISFERYAAICNPFQAIRLGVSRKTYFYITGAYLAGFIVQTPTIVGNHWAPVKNATVGYHCAYGWTSKTVSTTIFAAVFVCHFVIPAVIFIVNFYRIKKCLSKLDGDLRRSFGDARQRGKIMKSKEKTIRVVFVVMVAFFVLWTPNLLMYFLLQFGEINPRWNSNYYQAGIILAFSSSWLNPFLYAFQSKDFRSHCRKVFWKLLGRQISGRQHGGWQQSSSQSQSHSTSSSVKTKFRFQKLETPVEAKTVTSLN